MSSDALGASPQPVVSFLVLCGDNRRYLIECVQSILGQNFIDLEVLLIEDFPGADTAALAQAWANADARIRHIRLENMESRQQLWNTALAQSRGDLLWLMESGHALASPQVVQDWMTQFILNPQLGFAFCRAQCIDEHSVPYESYIPHKKDSDLPYQPTLFPGWLFFGQLLHENPLPPSAVIARKACYEKVGGFHPDVLENGALLHWFCFSLDWDVFFDPEPKVYCRQPRTLGAPSLQSPEALSDMLNCYEALDHYLKAGKYPRNLKRQVQLARFQFMRRKGMPMSVYEHVMRLYRKLTVRRFSSHSTSFHPA